MCLPRPAAVLLGWSSACARPQVQEVLEEETRNSRPGWHNTTGDKPAAGKSIFDRTPRVFQPLAPALRRRGFRPEWSSGPEVEERALRFSVPIRTIALTSFSLCTDESVPARNKNLEFQILQRRRKIFKKRKLILGISVAVLYCRAIWISNSLGPDNIISVYIKKIKQNLTANATLH